MNPSTPVIQEYHIDYQSFSEVLSDVVEVSLIDLTHYVYQLSDFYRENLLPNPPGAYFQNSLSPFLSFDRAYRSYTNFQNQNNEAPDITNFDSLIQAKGPIYDTAGNLVVTMTEFLKRALVPSPHYNIAAVKLAFNFALFAVRDLVKTKNVFVNEDELLFKSDEWFQRPSEIRNFIEEGWHESDRHIPGFSELRREILAFIKNDSYNYYHLNLRGTSLILSKGLDSRVIEYYRMVFNHLAEIAYESPFNPNDRCR